MRPPPPVIDGENATALIREVLVYAGFIKVRLAKDRFRSVAPAAELPVAISTDGAIEPSSVFAK
jgi:hypothetical protein